MTALQLPQRWAELGRRLEPVNTLKAGKDRSTDDARQYVEAMLGFEVYSDHIFRSLGAAVHGDPKQSKFGHHR